MNKKRQGTEAWKGLQSISFAKAKNFFSASFFCLTVAQDSSLLGQCSKGRNLTNTVDSQSVGRRNGFETEGFIVEGITTPSSVTSKAWGGTESIRGTQCLQQEDAMEGEFLPLQMLFACFGERIDAPLLETQSRGSENYWPRSRESSTVNCGKETRSPVLADGGKYRVALAFSGGLDSRLLAVLLRKAGMEPLLFHVFGPHSIRGESLKAVSWAYENAFTTVCLPLNPLVIPQVRANERRRCYYCKQAMFTAMSGMSDLPLCDGTLASDLKTYRPGLQALQELGVVSPLALAGFDKERVSGVALFLGLDRPDQPSQSCLLTRFGYDVPLDEGLLNEFALADAEITHYWEDFCQREGYGPVYQSLRLVDTQTLEWHIEGLALPITEGRALVERIGAVAPSLPPLRIRQVERVKGFFDTPLHNNIAT